VKLAPVGSTVKRNEHFHHRRRMQRGGGWSERDRANFRRWEENERAERWAVEAHVQPGEPMNSSEYPIYKLTSTLDGVIRTSYSLPYDWEEAHD